jgi:hypothetical protein
MNVRDPFGLRRSPAFNILRGTATQAAANVTQRVKEAGAQAYESGKQAVEDMSTFSIPRNVPSFTNPQRELENRVWGSSGVTARPATNSNGVISGMQDRVGGFFDKGRGDLPMYKDKPYTYASSRRQRPGWRRKRAVGIAGVLLAAVLYLFGFFGSHTENGENFKEKWSWLQKPEKAGPQVDWLDRRERVKEAFKLSWDAYERYAWGMRDAIPYSTPRFYILGANQC